MQASEWNSVIDHLAAKLAVPAAQLWSVLEHQGRLDGVYAVVWVVLSSIGLVLLFTKGVAKARELHDMSDGLLWVPWAFVTIAAVCVFAANLQTAITGLLNPRFLALKYILDAAK